MPPYIPPKNPEQSGFFIDIQAISECLQSDMAEITFAINEPINYKPMALAHIFYNSSTSNGLIVMNICRLHAETQGYTVTMTDISGKNAAQMLSAITDVTVNTMTAVYVAAATQATYSTAGKFIYDHIAELDNLLITASKGTSINAGTAQSNATPTNIIIASTASAVDDYYNGMYIRTAGTTAKNRYITDYTGSSKTVVCATTTTAITTTETYVVFTKSAKCYTVGDASSNITAPRVAWTTLFPYKQHPKLIQLIGGYGTIATDYHGNTDGVTTFKQADQVTKTATSAASTSLTDTGVFTASAYIGKYVGIESGTLGVGGIRKIKSNTADALTVDAWDVTPTGTIVYTVCDVKEYCLAHKYLPLVISTYLAGTDNATYAIWKQLFDKYGKITGKNIELAGDLELLQTYLQRGKCIFDAQAKGVVT